MGEVLYLVDSSAWIQLMRKSGDVAIKERLRELVARDQTAWCDVVRVELWRGAAGERDCKVLRDMEAQMRTLAMSQAVWDKCCDLARQCRRKGQPVPTTDMLVYSCAAVHGVELFHRDAHFDLLAQLDKA